MVSKLIKIIIPCLLLAACNTVEPKSTVELVNTSYYPDVPNIQKPLPINLIPFRYDFPRDADGKVSASCNLFIGFDERNWNIFVSNYEKMQSREIMWSDLIDGTNNIFEKWRNYNEEEAKKIKK